jgi:prophage regulatory protein
MRRKEKNMPEPIRDDVNHLSKKINLEDTKKRLPDEGYLRLWQIVGGKGYPGIIPISKSSWWAGVKSGRYPKPCKLSPRVTCWSVKSIRAIIERSERQ